MNNFWTDPIIKVPSGKISKTTYFNLEARNISGKEHKLKIFILRAIKSLLRSLCEHVFNLKTVQLMLQPYKLLTYPAKPPFYFKDMNLCTWCFFALKHYIHSSRLSHSIFSPKISLSLPKTELMYSFPMLLLFFVNIFTIMLNTPYTKIFFLEIKYHVLNHLSIPTLSVPLPFIMWMTDKCIHNL